MAEFTGDETSQTLTGTEENDTLTGLGGDDTLIGGDGSDTIFGGDGIDIAVFSGDFEEFAITDVGSGNNQNQLVVTNGQELSNFVNDVEILRFDDQDVSVLEFLDDFGDTPETGGNFSRSKTKFKTDRDSFFAKGTIDATGDNDLFNVTLEDGELYSLDFVGDSVDEAELLGVFDPNGDLIAGTTGELGDTVDFVANANGEFTVLVGSSGSATGSYGLFIEQLDLIGDAFSNGLKGTSGDDTLIPGAGDDTIDGGGGLDVVVFDGDRADFEISVGGSIFGSSSSTNPVTVSNENEGSDTVRNVETLRFNDQDVSILEFLDDIPEGTTRSLKFTKFGKLKSFGFSEKGRIDAIGDTDVFSVDLEEGDVFGVSIESADFFLRFEEEFGEESSPANELTIESVLDPSGDPIELVRDTSVDDEIGEVSFFRAAQAGTYLFTVAGVDEFVGDYQLDLQNALQTGDENSNFLIATPLDDTINGGAGEDQILFFGGGTDFIDGGADEDTISLSFELNELSLSVSDDDVITFTSAFGTFDVVNVENFIFDDFSEESSDEQSFDDLKELASVAPDAEPVTILLGDDDPDDLDGGNGNNVINSGAGDDEITDTGGDNNIDAGEGEDKVGLISGSNTVDGGADADLIIGGIGNDDLSGGDGNDIIRGDVSTNLFGSDTITGGAGDDLLEGRGGQDTFVFNPNNGDNTIGALDIDFDTPANTTVTGADFVAGVDLVSLVGFGLADADAAFALVSDVDGVATFADQSTTITFAGLTTADLSADDFVVAIDELL